ncbi:MAG: secretin N-terminal domain-containing protein, partial [Pseudomonadota bacterium]
MSFILLTGCITPPPESPISTQTITELTEDAAASKFQSIATEEDAASLVREQAKASIGASDIGNSTADFVYGSEEFVNTDRLEIGERESVQKRAGESFIFRNAPIDTVVNEVLGETFGVGYSIAPDVQGSLTLRLDGISSPEDAVSGLAAALQLQGVNVKETAGGYMISRAGRTAGGKERPMPVFVHGDTAMPEGASLAVLQLQYADTTDVSELARVLIADGLIKQVDDDRGFVILEGDHMVASATQILRALDVDWLSSVSTAMIPIQNASPSEISADLEPILARAGGISVIPLPRLDSLLVMSRRRDGLDQVRHWVTRLDQDAKPKLSTDTLVYEARYVEAAQLAEVVSGSDSQSNFLPTVGFSQSEEFGGSQQVPDSRGNGLYSDLAIAVHPGRNAVIARGASDELQSLGALFKSIDQPQRQVLIEATIVEVSLTDNNQFGVQW